MKPGVYANLTNEAHHKSPGISKSGLDAFRHSPQTYLWNVQGLVKKEETDALILGSAIHMAVLEPDVFAERYVCRPKSMKLNTKAGKDAYQDLLNENLGKIILKEEHYELSCQVAQAVRQNKTADSLLKPTGKYEHSVFWEDKETGLLMKCRPDYFDDDFIVDLKTTEDAGSRFSESIARYGYHRQAAIYQDGLLATDNIKRPFVFIAVEKTAPYLVQVHELDLESTEIGRMEYRGLIRKLAECKKTNHWPGLPEGITTASLPTWYLNANRIREVKINV
jgi:exodeoxyribonuclease VIII